MIKTVKPNYAHLGPKYKQKAKTIAQHLETMDRHTLYEELVKKKEIVLTVGVEKIRLAKEDFDIVEQEKEHIAKAVVDNATLFLDTAVTPELESEGLARELIRRVQSMRKEMNLHVEDKIITEIALDAARATYLGNWVEHIKEETRSSTVSFVDAPKGALVRAWTIDDLTVEIGIRK